MAPHLHATLSFRPASSRACRVSLQRQMISQMPLGIITGCTLAVLQSSPHQSISNNIMSHVNIKQNGLF